MSRLIVTIKLVHALTFRSSLLTIFLILVGCNGLKSRYAMDDPVYAQKYADGASKRDIPGKLKQAIDARHVEGLEGSFVGGGAMYRPKTDQTMAGADLGIENYRYSWLSERVSLGGYTSEDQTYLAVDGGFRVQTPTRLAPFAGIGALVGASRTVELADSDNVDNDDDKLTDEPGEKTSNIDHAFANAYSETGVHLWLNGNWRVTAFGRYMITSLGREHDDWMLGGQLSFFPRRRHELSNRVRSFQAIGDPLETQSSANNSSQENKPVSEKPSTIVE